MLTVPSVIRCQQSPEGFRRLNGRTCHSVQSSPRSRADDLQVDAANRSLTLPAYSRDPWVTLGKFSDGGGHE